MKNILHFTFCALILGFSNNTNAQCKPTIVMDADGHTLRTTATYLSYKWVTCPDLVIIPGATSSAYYVVKSGSYAVIVEKGSCIDTSDCMFVNPPTGINEEAISKNQVSVAPNPSSGKVYLKSPVALRGAYVAVYSINGQMQTSFILDATEKYIALNPGWHFITVDKDGWRETHKVLIVE